MKIKPKSTGPPKLTIRFDWRAYYREFVTQHGEPVEYQGRQLFPDGWSYSLSDYKGPEWPPPEDQEELRRLRRAYFLIRKRELRRQARECWLALTQLEETQAGHSVPLQRRVIVKDEETGERRWDHEAVDLEALRMRLEWLKDDEAKCDEHLKEIEDGQQSSEAE